MMLHCTTLCGRAGAALSSFTAHNRLTTLSAWIWMTPLRDYLRGLSSVRFRGGRDGGTMLYCTKRRAGTGVRWFVAHIRLTTLSAWIWVLTPRRDYLGGP